MKERNLNPIKPSRQYDFTELLYEQAHGQPPQGEGTWSFCPTRFASSDRYLDHTKTAPSGLTLTKAKKWAKMQPWPDEIFMLTVLPCSQGQIVNKEEGKLKKSGYREAVAWLAENDGTSVADAGAFSEFQSVKLVSDLFRVSAIKVAGDAIRFRNRPRRNVQRSEMEAVEPKHTRGPWTAYHWASAAWEVDDGNPFIVEFPKKINSLSELQANACVLSAAPDLLASLQQMVLFDELDPRERVPAVARARAAIAKAEGRS